MLVPSFAEVLVVAIGFGIVGLYMFIAHRIVKSGESVEESQSGQRP